MPEDFEKEHVAVLAEAAMIFKDRSRVRGQMWLDTTVSRELAMIDEKLKRAAKALVVGYPTDELKNEFEDSLLDLINFAVFAIKKERRGEYV